MQPQPVAHALPTDDLPPLEAQLFELLRRWRRLAASEQLLPLHWIATNATLVWLAKLRPGNREALAQVPGMGPARLELHANSLLRELREACERLGLDLADTVTRPPRQPRVPAADLEAMKERARQGFAAGLGIEVVAADCRARVQTVEGWLVAWVRETRPATLEPWLDEGTRARVLAVVDKLGRDRLKPIHDALGGTVPYVAIRLALWQP